MQGPIASRLAWSSKLCFPGAQGVISSSQHTTEELSPKKTGVSPSQVACTSASLGWCMHWGVPWGGGANDPTSHPCMLTSARQL